MKTYYAATSLIADNFGDHRCFFCGAPANRKKELSSAFVDWWTVAEPESEYCCDGCFKSFDEKMVMEGKDKPQKFRNYSWFVTADRLVALTKGSKLRIESLLLDPGLEPWAMALAVSGQKHLLYRTPVNYGHCGLSVRVEDTIVHYSPGELIGRIMLAKSVVAKVGVKRAESFDTTLVMAIGSDLAERWQAVINEPLTKLALFICPSKEDCASCQ